jgi:hypothetical protein
MGAATLSPKKDGDGRARESESDSERRRKVWSFRQASGIDRWVRVWRQAGAQRSRPAIFCVSQHSLVSRMAGGGGANKRLLAHQIGQAHPRIPTAEQSLHRRPHKVNARREREIVLCPTPCTLLCVPFSLPYVPTPPLVPAVLHSRTQKTNGSVSTADDL